MNRLVKNLISGLRLALFRKVSLGDFHISLNQAVYLIALDLALAFGSDCLASPRPAEINFYAFPLYTFYLALLLLAAYLIGRLLGKSRAMLSLLVLVESSALWLSLAGVLLIQFEPHIPVDYRAYDIAYYMEWGLFAWLLALLFICLKRVTQRPFPVVVFSWGLLLAIAVAPQFYLPRGVFWQESTAHAQAEYQKKLAELERRSVNAEKVFYAQPDLTQKLMRTLATQRPGVEDLYFVGFGAYGDEDVFRNEIVFAQQLFDRRFTTRDRSVALINHPDTIAATPIASVTNLTVVLNHLGTIMDKEEDILFLFLTSHGSKEHGLAVRLRPLSLNDLGPKTLKMMLADAGIQWKVIVISACHSGVFVNDLKDEHTLIMTAASADDTSFGCGSESDFTYFGNALFRVELQKELSFSRAFHAAARKIAEREKEEELEASNPQFHSTPAIEAKLKKWRMRLDP